jgi:hypothetical protein
VSWYIGFERRFEFDLLREPGFWEIHFGWLYFGAVDTRPTATLHAGEYVIPLKDLE